MILRADKNLFENILILVRGKKLNMEKKNIGTSFWPTQAVLCEKPKSLNLNAAWSKTLSSESFEKNWFAA